MSKRTEANAPFNSIIRHGFTNHKIETDDNSSETLKGAAQCQRHLRNAVRNYDIEAGHARTDPDLTEKGKAKKLAKTASTWLKNVNKHRVTIDGFRKRRDTLRAKVAATDDTDSAAKAIREMEARSVLREMTSAQRFDTLKKAIKTGDETTIRVFLNAPAGMDLAMKDQLDLARDVLLERKHPTLAAELNELEDVVEKLESSHHDARIGIANNAGVVLDDAASRKNPNPTSGDDAFFPPGSILSVGETPEPEEAPATPPEPSSIDWDAMHRTASHVRGQAG